MPVPLGALGRRFESCRPDWFLDGWATSLCARRAQAMTFLRTQAQKRWCMQELSPKGEKSKQPLVG
ncbi:MULTISPECIES: hypothetical protein [unclassified Prochlorococcus]|uniref:hypothetical protein n=1 Tax=unclassified Prochlorococcus TaxID=2627481 RepID=UPI000A791257|nr:MULTISPECIES: hypothetical protein [unclassified Prochlorococcus]